MRMERQASDGPVISGFSGRGFKVDGGVYDGLLITPERADGWSPPPIEALAVGDLEPLLALDPQPEFVILGTGAVLVRPAVTLVAALEARRIGLEVMDSRAAARAWGVLRAEKRWISGALYPL
ncbi:MTH938/NDUFAF3 family protein [Sphingomonas sp. AOB5]|uniref:MTH938/NDUFAF3 family protein n=1 Tax=Sphingomonas sp. AOB5 TaxID=3034017 RepID=UPI0023F9C3EC|nr:MTH938/NDUFAF3 family protein [Sphingomonas sp. AOB5]MDF7776927.1 MTH938/NDUFAF3 family protein [Sphingomonas sp. AOB5]